jgi:ABC-type sugar transport system permease subunit
MALDGVAQRPEQASFRIVTYHRVVNVWGFVFCVPALAFFAGFKFFPMLQAFALSFFAYDLLSPPVYVGLDNYEYLAHDPTFHQALGASAQYLLGTTIPAWVLALGMALIFNQRFPGRTLLRVLYFMPVLIAQIVVAVLWKFLYHPNGFINSNLSILGVPRIEWLTDQNTAMVALVIVALWRLAPYFMIVFLAGLQAIPQEYYEASSIDGAGQWQQFRYITMPLLKPTIFLVIVMTMLFSVRQFLYPLVLTGGGPAGATRVVPLIVFETAFSFLKMGLASAMATVLFVLVMLLTVLQFRMFREGQQA